MQLMQLRDVNISVDAKMKIHSKFEEKCPPLRKTDLIRLMVRAKILSSIQNYDEWITFVFVPLNRFFKKE